MGTITLNHITKVEGHAKLTLEIKDNKVKKCELGSVEGSRYFEGLLVGRNWNEPQEIATRICGICSSGHNVTAIKAMEKTLGVTPSKQSIALRTLQTIGERIRSHAAHLYFLALPDYLGYESAIAMAPKYKKEVACALRIMKLGNDMVRLVSGRVMHPVAPTIGGWLHFPSQESLDTVRDRLVASKEDVMETCKLFNSIKYPEFSNETQYLSVVSDDDFGTVQGDLKIGGVTYKESQFHDFISEYHEPFSSANFAVRDKKAYSVGALARFNNNVGKLSSETKKFMKHVKVKFPCYNPFINNLCQAIELIHYRESCIKLLDNFKVEREELPKIDIRAGHGIAATEVPRGTLWHEYKVDDNGKITYANILTPTAQFLRNLNEDIAKYVQQLLDNKATKETIVLEIEKLIRSYDPCFSCSSHFLKVDWK